VVEQLQLRAVGFPAELTRAAGYGGVGYRRHVDLPCLGGPTDPLRPGAARNTAVSRTGSRRAARSRCRRQRHRTRRTIGESARYRIARVLRPQQEQRGDDRGVERHLRHEGGDLAARQLGAVGLQALRARVLTNERSSSDANSSRGRSATSQHSSRPVPSPGSRSNAMTVGRCRWPWRCSDVWSSMLPKFTAHSSAAGSFTTP
jgi:hypothetical protein